MPLTDEIRAKGRTARWARTTPQSKAASFRKMAAGLILKAEELEAMVADWPAPTPEQTDRLRDLLPPVVEGDSDRD